MLCLFDVLGFESLLNRIGLKKLAERYDKLTEYVKEQRGGIDIVPTPDRHVAIGWFVVDNAYFSDTFLFWTSYNKISLPHFTYLIAETICYGIEHELPLRGTLTVGEMILDGNSGTYLGKPIIEAVRTEQLQQWIGLSFGPSFSKPDFKKGFYLNTVLPYKSHYKDKANPLATGMVVDWPRRWRETRKANIRSLVSRMDKDLKFSQYYIKTLEFIDFSERNHDWFKKQNHLDYG
ncbi:hypothetical protein KAW65_00095 [candidate division WOR-3 bacterium]|nr:hypothetical protein [candidate division WOR-3 bacterium]